MQQVNTLGIAAGGTIDIGRETATDGGLPRAALCRLTQGGQRFFKAIRALLRQITSDTQPNSAYYLGTYVPFLDTTQPIAWSQSSRETGHIDDGVLKMAILALCAPPQAVFGTGRCRA